MPLWGVITAGIMSLAALISFIPFIPGPALVWAIGILYAALTGFEQVGLGAAVIMTLLMLIGSTADWWTRLFGLKGEGKLSCGTFVVSTVGAILGTIFIPIPLVGTLIGGAGAVGLLVWYQQDDEKQAWQAARGILSAWIASFFVEFVVCISMIVVFVRALMAA